VHECEGLRSASPWRSVVRLKVSVSFRSRVSSRKKVLEVALSVLGLAKHTLGLLKVCQPVQILERSRTRTPRSRVTVKMVRIHSPEKRWNTQESEY
jgi:hypothetical protein